MPLIEFDTPRLQLRQWRGEDCAPFAALNADPRVMEFLPGQLDRPASDALADRMAGLISERGWGCWAVALKHSGDFIGFVGLHVPVPELPCSPCVEIGWRLGFDHWGQGYATEAARAALQVGFEQIGLTEIVAFTSLLNRRSQAVMARLGMQRDAATFHHPALAAGHPLSEHCLYRITAARLAAASAG